MSCTKPRILKADGQVCDPATICSAVEALARGQLVILPTDTVYGLACRADDEAAVIHLFESKRRPLTKPLPLLLASAEALVGVALGLDENILRLARQFWPGPLTIVIRKSPSVSDTVTAGGPTVGVRVPDLPLTQAILEAARFPVAVTSANFSDEDPACSMDDLPRDLLAQVCLVIEAGSCPGMTPSTVVDVTQTPPRVLRPGPVSDEQIRAALSASL